VAGGTPNFPRLWTATSDANGNYCVGIEIENNGEIVAQQSFNNVVLTSNLST
jgi:hypothetical protein